jgi:Protein of unknown function (DUF998)
VNASFLRQHLVWVVVGGCLVLLASVVLGGALNDGYSQTRDYVSALSGRGTSVAFVGMLGLLGFSLAHAAAGLSFRSRSRGVFVALILAAGSGVVVALARINCSDGAARCSVDDGVTLDWLDRTHGFGVVAYEVFFVVGVLVAAWWLARGPKTDGTQRATGALLGALALGSVVLLASTPDGYPGAVQRAWLLINATAIILLTVAGSRAQEGISTR